MRLRQTGGQALLDIQGVLHAGSGVHLDNAGEPCRIVVQPNAVLRLGRDVFLNWGADVFVTTGVEIGEYTMIGPRCFITDTAGHAVAPDEGVVVGRVLIGRNVWIGHSVHVLPGVTIGDHAVVGAGSVVTKSIPPRVTAAGVPARVIRSLDIPDSWIRNGELS